jgi:hypothetical protein
MRRAGIDLDFVRDPGTLQFPGKGRDMIHGYGRVRPTMGNQDRRRIGRIDLAFRRLQAPWKDV